MSIKEGYNCSGQESLLQLFPKEMQTLPPIGSWIYFVTGVVVRRVRVKKHTVGSSALPGYIYTEDKGGDVYYVKYWHYSKDEAVEAVRSFYQGEVKVIE